MKNPVKMPYGKTLVSVLIILAVCAASLIIRPAASSVENHQPSITYLNEKRDNVTALTATTAGLSVVIAMVPGDSTTPIAAQVAGLTSILLLVECIITMEKGLVCAMGTLAFYFLIPAACVLMVIYVFTKRKPARKLSLTLGIAGFLLFFLIPGSTRIGKAVDEALQTDLAVQTAAQTVEELKENAPADEGSEEDEGIMDRILGIGSNIANGVSTSLEMIETAIGHLMDGIADIVITSFVIPIVIMLALLWIIRILVNILT